MEVIENLSERGQQRFEKNGRFQETVEYTITSEKTLPRKFSVYFVLDDRQKVLYEQAKRMDEIQYFMQEHLSFLLDHGCVYLLGQLENAPFNDCESLKTQLEKKEIVLVDGIKHF